MEKFFLELINFSFLSRIEKFFLDNFNIKWAILFSLIIVYSLLQLPPYFLYAFVPDEIYYNGYNYNHNITLNEVGFFRYIFNQENTIGYGSFYWMVYLFLRLNFEDSLVAMRVVSLICVIGFPLLLSYEGFKNKSIYTFLTVILWLSFPNAWWYTKIVGPTFLSMFIMAIGLYMVTSENLKNEKVKSSGWIFLTLGLGIKVHSVPIFIFAGIYRLFDLAKMEKRERCRLIGRDFLFFLIGLFLSNPFLIFGLEPYLANIFRLKYPSNFTWHNFLYIMSNNDWEWDIEKRGGLFQWSLNGISFAFYLLFLLKTRIPLKPILSLVGSFVTIVVLVLNNTRFVGWYWFAFNLLIPYTILKIPNPSSEKSKKVNLLFLFFIIALNLPTSLKAIKSEYKLKIDHHIALMKGEHVLYCIKSRLGDREKYDTVFNFTDYGLPIEYKFLLKDEVNGTLSYLAGAHTLLNPNDFHVLQGKQRSLIMIGERFQKYMFAGGFEKIIQDKILPPMGPGGRVTYLGNCFPIDIYEFTKDPVVSKLQ